MKTSDRKLLIHAALLGLVLLIPAWFSLTRPNFFSVDTGLRFLQVQELLQRDWSSFAVSYPARFLDAELAHVPYYFAYFVVDGELFLRISALFTLLTSLLVAFMDSVGLVVLPVGGVVASALAIVYLGRLARLESPVRLLWLSALGTPLLFYGLELWDHTFTVAFALWAVALFARALSDEVHWPALAAGMLAAVAWTQRPEFSFFTAAATLGFLLSSRAGLKPLLLFIVGNVLVAAPMALAHQIWFGHALGPVYAPQLLDYGVPQSYPFQSSPGFTRTYKATQFLTYIQSGALLNLIATVLGLVVILFWPISHYGFRAGEKVHF